jgi:hypothetical protein
MGESPLSAGDTIVGSVAVLGRFFGVDLDLFTVESTEDFDLEDNFD